MLLLLQRLVEFFLDWRTCWWERVEHPSFRRASSAGRRRVTRLG